MEVFLDALGTAPDFSKYGDLPINKQFVESYSDVNKMGGPITETLYTDKNTVTVPSLNRLIRLDGLEDKAYYRIYNVTNSAGSRVKNDIELLLVPPKDWDDSFTDAATLVLS